MLSCPLLTQTSRVDLELDEEWESFLLEPHAGQETPKLKLLNPPKQALGPRLSLSIQPGKSRSFPPASLGAHDGMAPTGHTSSEPAEPFKKYHYVVKEVRPLRSNRASSGSCKFFIYLFIK